MVNPIIKALFGTAAGRQMQKYAPVKKALASVRPQTVGERGLSGEEMQRAAMASTLEATFRQIHELQRIYNELPESSAPVLQPYRIFAQGALEQIRKRDALIAQLKAVPEPQAVEAEEEGFDAYEDENEDEEVF